MPSLTLSDALLAPAPISLPPGFAGFAAEPGRGAFDCARRVADREGAGTFVLAEPGPVLDMAVVLEPAEALRSARRALHLGAVALAEAVGSYAPPEIPVTIAWPDTLVFNGARLGGVRLGWPDEADPAHVPDWLVLGAALIATKAKAGEPGLTPDSTALDEEGFVEGDAPLIAEAFARHLKRLVRLWDEDGFGPVAEAYLGRLAAGEGGPWSLDAEGDLVAASGARRSLAPTLAAPTWLDPIGGGPRL